MRTKMLNTMTSHNIVNSALSPLHAHSVSCSRGSGLWLPAMAFSTRAHVSKVIK